MQFCINGRLTLAVGISALLSSEVGNAMAAVWSIIDGSSMEALLVHWERIWSGLEEVFQDRVCQVANFADFNHLFLQAGLSLQDFAWLSSDVLHQMGIESDRERQHVLQALAKYQQHSKLNGDAQKAQQASLAQACPGNSRVGSCKMDSSGEECSAKVHAETLQKDTIPAKEDDKVQPLTSSSVFNSRQEVQDPKTAKVAGLTDHFNSNKTVKKGAITEFFKSNSGNQSAENTVPIVCKTVGDALQWKEKTVPKARKTGAAAKKLGWGKI